MLIGDIEQDMLANEDREFFDRSFVQQIIQYLNQSIYSSTLVNNLINDLLDIAKFEAGTFQFYEEYFDLLDVINCSFSIIEHQTQKKQITLSLQLHHISQLDFENLEKIQSQSDFQNEKPVQKAFSLAINKFESSNQKPIEQLKKGKPFSQKNLNFIDVISKQNLSQQSNSLIESEISPKQYNRSQRSIFDSNQCELDKLDSFDKKIQNQLINEFNETKIKKLFSNIFGDRNRYQQILINFLSNAVKFTNKGGNITIRLIIMDQQKFADKKYARSYNQKSQKQNIFQDSREKQLQKQNDGAIIDQTIIQIPKIQSNDSVQSLFGQQSEQHQNNKEQLLSESLPRIQTFQDINSLENINKQKFENITDFQRSKEEFKINTQKGSKSTFDEGFISFLIQVIDNGIGIKDENIGKLFLDFSKLNEHASMNRGGTGLGLSICKKIIEKMGGQVSVKSQLNKGTQFTVKLRTKFKEIEIQEKNKSDTKSLDDVRSEMGNHSSQSKESQLNHSHIQSSQLIISDQQLQSSKDQKLNIIKDIKTKQRKMSHQQQYKKFGLNLSSSKEYVLSSKDKGIQSIINSSYSNVSLKKSQMDSLQQSSASLISVVNINQQKNSAQNQIEDSAEDFYNKNKNSSKLSQNSENIINRGIQKQISVSNIDPQNNDQILDQKQKNSSIKFSLNNNAEFFSIRKESSGYHKMSAEWGGFIKRPSQDNIQQKIDESAQDSPLNRKSEINKSSSSNSIKLNLIFQNRSKNSSHQQSVKEEEKQSSNQHSDQQQYQQERFGQSNFNNINQNKEQNRMSLNDDNQQNNQNIDKNRSLKSNSKKSKKSKQKEQDKQYEGIRCLVANDNEFQLMVINHILQKCKFEILEAINGFDALEQVQKSKLPFDFIMLDLDMPIMSGYEAADAIIQHHKTSQNVLAPQKQQINKSKKDQGVQDNILNNKSIQGKSENQLLQQQLLKMMDKDIPILIALSSLVDDQVRQRCYDCGFDLVLEAPLSQDHIDQEIMPMVIKNRNLQNQLQQIQEE